MRKITVIVTMLLLSIGTLRAFAQDATPTPDPSTQQQSQQVDVPGFIGLDIFTRAAQATQAQDYQQAIADYSLFLLLNPTNSQAYFQRGSAYYQLKDYISALADVNHALSLPQATTDLTSGMYSLRARIYVNQKQDDLALSDFNAGIEAAPTDPSLYYNRGLLYARQSQWQDAVTDFGKVVELAPDVTDGYALRAAANIQLQQYDAALADYTKLVTLTPNDPAVFSDRARIYIQLKNYESALADLNDALRLSPKSASLYLLRGSVNNELGKQADAAADYLEWVRSQQTSLNSQLTLRPNESQVVQMQAGQIYLMTFEAQAGQKVTITASARPTENTDPILLLVDNTAHPLVADDDSGGNYDALISDYVLPADGQYGVQCVGSFQLRQVARKFCALRLRHEPPRRTRRLRLDTPLLPEL